MFKRINKNISPLEDIGISLLKTHAHTLLFEPFKTLMFLSNHIF